MKNYALLTLGTVFLIFVIKSTLAITITGAVISEEYLKHHFSFEKNVDDRMQNSKPLSYGPRFVEGKIGKAIKFNGGGDYFRIFQTFFEKHNNLAVSLWIKPEGTTNDIQIILWQGKGDGGDDGTQDEARLFLNEEGNEVTFRMTTLQRPLEVSGSLIKNEWNHVVVVAQNLDYLNFSADIYINSNLTDHHEINRSSITKSYDNRTLYVGKPEANARYFKGSLDELRLYKYLLTEKEVKELYNEGVACHLDSDCKNNTKDIYCSEESLCTNTTFSFCRNPARPDSYCELITSESCTACNSSCSNQTCVFIDSVLPSEEENAVEEDQNIQDEVEVVPQIAQEQETSSRVKEPGFFRKLKCKIFHPFSKDKYESCKNA